MKRWRAHVGAGVLVAVSALLALVATVGWVVAVAVPCAPDYSESTVIAPDSFRGRLLCSVTDGELAMSTPVVLALVALPLAAIAAAAVVWVRRRRWRPVVLWCVAAVLLPWVVRGALVALPADCTAAQRAAHGDRGCERSEEQRPGLGGY